MKALKSSKAEERALEAYPNERFISEDYADMCRSFFIEGYEQAEKDIIDRLAEFYPTLDYTFRSYMLQAFPELKGKIEHYD